MQSTGISHSLHPFTPSSTLEKLYSRQIQPRGGLPWWLSNKESACNAGDAGSTHELGRSPWRRKWQPTSVFWPGKSHGWRSLVGCSPWGHEESDTTEPLHFHFSLPCTGERNGNPLQYSCLGNPMDRGAWWGYSPWDCKELDMTEQLSITMMNPYQPH